MTDSVFYFSFYFDDDTEQTLAFAMDLGPWPDIDALMNDAAYEEAFETLESEHGVHDFSSGPTDHLEGIGYNSYEVPKARTDSLMARWREALIAMGVTAGPVVSLDNADQYDNDLAVFQAVVAQAPVGTKRSSTP
jgi:hypothetical protein